MSKVEVSTTSQGNVVLKCSEPEAKLSPAEARVLANSLIRKADEAEGPNLCEGCGCFLPRQFGGLENHVPGCLYFPL